LNRRLGLKNQIETDLSNYGKYRYYKRIRKDGFNKYKIVPYTRGRAIKYYCLECVGFSYSEMAKCSMPECLLFPYRFGKLPEDKTSQDRAKDIRAHCMECCSGDIKYIAECPSKLCPVHPFRLSGYKTDLTSLIPVKEVEILPEYEGGIVNLKAKIMV
jgi:hypothetical protein